MTSRALRAPNAVRQAPLTPPQKAAIILASLPREMATAIIGEIDDHHVRAFFDTLSELTSVPADAASSIAREFIAAVAVRRDEVAGGAAEARRILFELTNRERAERVVAVAGGSALGNDVWKRIAMLPRDRVVSFLLEQRLSVAAAVLSQLPADHAAEILANAPDGFAKSILPAMARIQAPSPEAIRAIEMTLETGLLARKSEASSDDGSAESVSEIFNYLPSALRDALIAHLETEKGDLGARIRKLLLTFETLPVRLTGAGAATLLRTVERDILLAALKHGQLAATETVAFLLENMSKRMADQFREDLAALPPPTLGDGEKAQRSIVAAVKTLEKAGEIKLVPAI
ncbi:MAG: FliG C-terminal domain-containing protein [Parvularculaceae bacterium]